MDCILKLINKYSTRGGSASPRRDGQEHEDYNSTPSSAKVKNGGDISPLPHTSTCCGAPLIEPRNIFPFLLCVYI
jgi:hypothetical protein